MNRHLHTAAIITSLLSAMALMMCGCITAPGKNIRDLQSELTRLTDSLPGRIGVAFISPQGDTVTVNNTADYPLMSVFKLHQAIAVIHALDSTGTSIDTHLSLCRDSLNHNTWSPMLKDHSGPAIKLPIRQLLAYTLQQSDNNASNVMFDSIITVSETDRYLHRIASDPEFELKWTEAQMQRDHRLSRDNRSTPLACAALIDKLFTDSLASPDNQQAIKQLLLECKTGTDRISAPLAPMGNVSIAHKTGSGYRDDAGLLMAHNDVARITLPDGRTYTLAVLVTDFPGTEAEASGAIARISEAVMRWTEAQP